MQTTISAIDSNINLIMPVVPKSTLNMLVYILVTRAYFENKLKKNCWSELKQELSIKYFVKFCLIPKKLQMLS